MDPELSPTIDHSQPGVLWPKDREVVTADGATIRYTFLGPADGPTVALCPGWLCPDTWWWSLAPALARAGYRVLLYHPRGHGSSGLPARTHAAAFTIPRLAGDLGDIVEAEGIDALALVGHSVGVQIALESYRQLGPRVWSLTAITGPYASPVRTLYGRGWIAGMFYESTRWWLKLSPTFAGELVWSTAWSHMPALTLGRLITAFGPRTRDDVVDTYAAHMATRSIPAVIGLAEGAHNHTAEDLLDDFAVPALIVQGGRDPFCPTSVGEEMAARMPDATYRIAHHGTHGTLLEYPELVNGWVLDHLDRNRAAHPRSDSRTAG